MRPRDETRRDASRIARMHGRSKSPTRKPHSLFCLRVCECLHARACVRRGVRVCRLPLAR